MFLDFKKLAVIFAGIFISASGYAAGIDALDAGEYKLKSGDKELCAESFEISAKQLKSSNLIIAGVYMFELKSGNTETVSDLDAHCVFKEKSLREDTGVTETKLKRVNQELCSGKVKSLTTSQATITRGEIRVLHKVDNAEPYECVWKKK